MKAEDTLRIQALVDGELDAVATREVEALVARDPEARQLHDALRQWTRLVREHEPEPPLPVPVDAFWSGIARRLESTPPQTTARQTGWLELLRRWGVSWKFAVPVGLTALLTLSLFLTSSPPPPAPSTNPDIAAAEFEAETEIPNASLMTFHSEADGLTVVWIDIP